MIEALLMLMLAQAEPEFIVERGACTYEGTDRAGPGEQRIPCTGMVISHGREADDVLIQFPTGSGAFGFAGEIDGDTVTVRRLYPKAGLQLAATGGHCRLFYNGDDLAGVACVGRSAGKVYVANFRSFKP